MKTPLNKYYPNMSPTVNALTRSILAGATAVTFSNPIWVVKTRLQLQTNVDPELISLYDHCAAFLHDTRRATLASKTTEASSMLSVVSTAKKASRHSSAVFLFPIWVLWRPRFSLHGICFPPLSFSSYDVFKRKLNEHYEKPSKLQVGLSKEYKRSCSAQPHWPS